MTDVSFALEAKSDQLNAVDIIGAEPVLKIRQVSVRDTQDQPIWIYYEGDNGRPWKPSKGMLRILAAAWGRDSSQWEGGRVQVYFEPSVKYAGEEVGGIRIKALSGIDQNGMTCTITINRQKRQPYRVECLQAETEQFYPQDKFDKALPKMTEMMQSGDMSLQQVIAQCQKTGRLTDEQIQQLEQAAPVEIEEEHHEQPEAADDSEDEDEEF